MAFTSGDIIVATGTNSSRTRTADQIRAALSFALTNYANTFTAANVFTSTLTGTLTGNCSGTAANITGVLAVANGGTGVTSNANTANGVVLLDGSAKLPAVDGSQLTNLPSSGTTILVARCTAATTPPDDSTFHAVTGMVVPVTVGKTYAFRIWLALTAQTGIMLDVGDTTYPGTFAAPASEFNTFAMMDIGDASNFKLCGSFGTGMQQQFGIGGFDRGNAAMSNIIVEGTFTVSAGSHFQLYAMCFTGQTPPTVMAPGSYMQLTELP
jgi:hypothetical protein